MPAGDRPPCPAGPRGRNAGVGTGVSRPGRGDTTTPWAAGRLDTRARPPRLLFGRTMEDPAIELGAFGLPAGAPVVCIASAGDTALALAAAGHRVIAVDHNPRQIDEVRRRLRGEPAHRGDADRLLAAGRTLLRPVGWSPVRLTRFCALTDTTEQAAEWAALTGPAVHTLLDRVLRPWVLRLAFGPPFAGLVPPGFAAELLTRVGRGVARFPNRDNPWISLLLTGEWPVPPPDPDRRAALADRIELREGDVADVLADLPAGSLAGISLSNVLDGPAEVYRLRVLGQARRAAAVGAPILSRSLLAGTSPVARARATTDRSLLWGAIEWLDGGTPPVRPVRAGRPLGALR